MAPVLHIVLQKMSPTKRQTILSSLHSKALSSSTRQVRSDDLTKEEVNTREEFYRRDDVECAQERNNLFQ